MADELVDIVDDKGNVLRQALKSEAHEHGWLHKTVIGGVITDDGIALVRQSSDRQDAGQLVMPIGGHVKAGESDEDALLRESEEEIGTRDIAYELVGMRRFHREVLGRDENHLFVIYKVWVHGEVVLGSEADTYETFTIDELKAHLEQKPGDFGDAYYFELEHFYPEYLPAHYKNRWKIS